MEKLTEQVPILRQYIHPDCDGELVYAGHKRDSDNGKLYTHICNKCQMPMELSQVYPARVFVSVDEAAKLRKPKRRKAKADER